MRRATNWSRPGQGPVLHRVSAWPATLERTPGLACHLRALPSPHLHFAPELAPSRKGACQSPPASIATPTWRLFWARGRPNTTRLLPVASAPPPGREIRPRAARSPAPSRLPCAAHAVVCRPSGATSTCRAARPCNVRAYTCRRHWDGMEHLCALPDLPPLARPIQSPRMS